MNMLSPQRVTLAGRYATLVPLNAEEHAAALWQAVQGPQPGPHNDALWLYMGDGPYTDFASFRTAIDMKAMGDDVFFAILGADRRAVGYACLMRIDVKNRVVEVGNILYSPRLQKTRAATEAMYLLARYVFEDLNYRRYEWKCNALNEPSRRAATRYGFVFEGLFRQHMMVKGRNRDTAWYSMLDSEWPARKAAFEQWLAPANFDGDGLQKRALNPE